MGPDRNGTLNFQNDEPNYTCFIYKTKLPPGFHPRNEKATSVLIKQVSDLACFILLTNLPLEDFVRYYFCNG